jgi:DNA-3-methyladenine glycosylase II
MPFPAPDDLALLKPDELRALGFSRQKGQAIITLARAVAAGHVHLDELESLDDAAAVARLRTLRGVGRWTAEYVLLRGLGRLHVFPGDDSRRRNNLQRWLGLLEPLDYDGVCNGCSPDGSPSRASAVGRRVLWRESCHDGRCHSRH